MPPPPLLQTSPPYFTGSQHLLTPPALVQAALAPLQRLVYLGTSYSQALHGRWAPTKALQRQRASTESRDSRPGVWACSLPKGRQVTTPTPAETEEQGKNLRAARAQPADAGLQPAGSTRINIPVVNAKWGAGWHGLSYL